MTASAMIGACGSVSIDTLPHNRSSHSQTWTGNLHRPDRTHQLFAWHAMRAAARWMVVGWRWDGGRAAGVVVAVLVAVCVGGVRLLHRPGLRRDRRWLLRARGVFGTRAGFRAVPERREGGDARRRTSERDRLPGQLSPIPRSAHSPSRSPSTPRRPTRDRFSRFVAATLIAGRRVGLQLVHDERSGARWQPVHGHDGHRRFRHRQYERSVWRAVERLPEDRARQHHENERVTGHQTTARPRAPGLSGCRRCFLATGTGAGRCRG